LQKLFALLAGLIAKVIHLTFSLLPNRRTIDELLPLTLRLLNDVFCLLPGRIDEVIAAFNQLCRPLNFFWESVAHGIENFDGIPFIHESATGKWETTAFQYDLLELIKLIENGEPHVVHLSGVRKLN
jgi:hypothetical protein